jgi:hypothetical protein
MNSDQQLNLLKQVITMLGGMAAGAGLLHITMEQVTTVANDMIVIIPAAISLGSIVWSVYAHWRMKKVPVTAVAVQLPATVEPPVVGERVALTGIGTGKVVA